MARVNRDRLARQVASLRAEVDDASQKLAARHLTGLAYVDAELARIGGPWRWQEADQYQALSEARTAYAVGFPASFLADRLGDWIIAAAYGQPEPPVSLPPGWEHASHAVAARLREVVGDLVHAEEWRAAPPSGNESPEWLAAMAELHDRIAHDLPLATEPLSPWDASSLDDGDVAALIAEAQEASWIVHERAEVVRREQEAERHSHAYRSTRQINGYP